MADLVPNPRVILCILLALALVICASAQYPRDVEYRPRDHRYEGIKSQPTSGYYLELISGTAMPSNDGPITAEALKLRFYLKEVQPVYITVRERDVQHNYWLDQVSPREPWRVGFTNEFDWPAREVLARLKPTIRIENLAALARLGKATPSQNESIAPVILYQSRFPKAIEGYRFSFVVNVDARLSCSIYKENGSSPVVVENFPRELAGRPFTFVWNSRGALEGTYRLVIKGKKRSNNEEISLYIQFYHQPRLG